MTRVGNARDGKWKRSGHHDKANAVTRVGSAKDWKMENCSDKFLHSSHFVGKLHARGSNLFGDGPIGRFVARVHGVLRDLQVTKFLV